MGTSNKTCNRLASHPGRLTILLVGSGEQGWHSGESARLPPMWPRFESRTRYRMWVEFVVGSRPFPKGFSPAGYSGFPPSPKINSTKFQFNLGSEGHRFVSHKTVY